MLSSFSYTYRGDGNIASERDHNNVTIAYTYDLLGRLVSEVGGYSRYYSYDAAGNRTQAIVDTSTTICYTYDSDGRLVSETKNSGSVLETTVYSYDANGSLISENDGDVTSYTYDVWGNMTSAGNASYAYNAQGLRISKTVSGVTDNFVLVGGDVWADSESTYLRGLELISSDDYFYLYNIRGDVIQLLDYNGEVVKTYDYDAYGNELSRDLSDENPFRYCGEYYDTETGLIYLRARYYDPSVGRFTSLDPIKDGLNWYAYCNCNPVMLVDSNGLWPSLSQILTAAAIVLTAAVLVTAVVATAGAAGAAIGLAAGIATGSTAIIGSVSTAATIAGYCVAGYVGATAISDVGEVFTGTNVIRERLFNGNQQAYDTSKTIAYTVAAGYVEVGSANSGLTSKHSKNTASFNNAEEADNTDDIIKTNTRQSNTTVDELIDSVQENTTSKNGTRNFVSSGGYEQAVSDFDSLGPKNVTNINTSHGPGKMGYIDGSTKVVARPYSKTGGATLEINLSRSRVYKIRY